MKNEASETLLAAALAAVDRPVFVVGTMRSGTGFLGLSLNQANDLIGCPFELRRVWAEDGNVPMASDLFGRDCPQFVAEDANRVPLIRLKKAFAAEVMKNFGHKQLTPTSRFLSKNPHLCNKLGLVKALFPQAQIIATVRSFDQVVGSLRALFAREGMRIRGIRHYWPELSAANSARCFGILRTPDNEGIDPDRIFPGGSITWLAEYWLESNLAIMRQLQADGPMKVTLAPQNLLIEQPQALSAHLNEFLGTSFACFPSPIDSSRVTDWSTIIDGADRNRLSEFREKRLREFEIIESALNTFASNLHG